MSENMLDGSTIARMIHLLREELRGLKANVKNTERISNLEDAVRAIQTLCPHTNCVQLSTSNAHNQFSGFGERVCLWCNKALPTSFARARSVT